MVKDGYLWVLFPLAAGLAAGLLYLFWPALPLLALAFVLLLLAAFMAYFFRDPQRTVPAEAGLVVSPADGKVTRIERLSSDGADSPTVVSIFLSPFDVHVNRSPIAGTVLDVTYTKGRFTAATSDNASLVNEQNALTIRGEQLTLVCKQIAGVLARRIVCWKRPGDKLEAGERFGLIKFGSRTDLVLPPEVEVVVAVGARVSGGVSVIGRYRIGE
jgi:phosphatidylserine decarboxylase